jgi:hypothetical protein
MSGRGTTRNVEAPRRGRRSWRVAALTTISALVASSLFLVAPAGAQSNKKKQPTGTLTVQATNVTVLEKGATKFTKAKRNQKISIGDTIQTDAAGLAEVEFSDGSLTRLDHNTIFTLDALVQKTGRRQVEGTVSAGQTWNRVQKLSETENFKQKGNGATAAVLGTAFLTKCGLPAGTAFKIVKTKKALKKLEKASTCQFTLVDGRLQLTSLGKVVAVGRGQSVSVDAAGTAGDAVTVPPDILFSDAWITSNLDLDFKAGLAEAVGTATGDDLKQARIEGSWPAALQVTGTTGFRDLAAGTTRDRTYTFTVSCTGGSCSVALTRDTANGPRTIPLTYSDGVYSGTDPELGVQNCELDNGTVSVFGGIQNSQTISLSPTSAVPQAGLWKATELRGTVTETAEQIAGGAGQCRTGSATFNLTASRGA